MVINWRKKQFGSNSEEIEQTLVRLDKEYLSAEAGLLANPLLGSMAYCVVGDKNHEKSSRCGPVYNNPPEVPLANPPVFFFTCMRSIPMH